MIPTDTAREQLLGKLCVTESAEDVLDILRGDIQKEITALCSNDSNSVLWESSLDAFSSLTWDRLTSEVRISQSPSLVCCFRYMCEYHTKRKCTRIQEPALFKISSPGKVCCNYLQLPPPHKAIISLILHSGHIIAKHVRLKFKLFIHSVSHVYMNILGVHPASEVAL